MSWEKAVVIRFHSNMVSAVDIQTNKRLECVLPGKFKQQHIRPVVGDYIEYSSEENAEYAKVENILPRKNELYRPKIANVDQVVLVTTIKNPPVDNIIVDKFLMQVQKQRLDCVIVVNKIDLLQTVQEKELLDKFVATYSKILKVITVSVKQDIGIEEVRSTLCGKITTTAGMSGVGKSSLINKLDSTLNLKVNEISDRLKRGRHTTTFSELIAFSFGGFLADTPGFANLELRNFECATLKDFFPEFRIYEPYCAFNDCIHINEPGCAVKQAVQEKEISSERYNNYLSIYKEIKESGEKKW
ncbi:MAG: ribosome small subunit-dependent GTPase A [Petrotogaceae bacterium]|nr:ribosome small subunit-dependent GTPase A [Petrotogaceae bacterium]